MQDLHALSGRVCAGGEITREEALSLFGAPLDALCRAADNIRQTLCGDAFDLCAIVNAKNGGCPEDCNYCAQSRSGAAPATLSVSEIVRHAKNAAARGILRFSIVTSGRRLNAAETEEMCRAVRAVRTEAGLPVCGSFGLLTEEQFRALKDAGLSRVHNNLEASPRYFPEVCTTHTFEDKRAAVRAAQNAGLEVCSGGIIGMGETVEDRVGLALELRALGVRSVPINVLNPIPGTPFGTLPPLSPDEVRRTVAVFRFLLPRAFLRLAGGRSLLPDRGAACFRSGANAAISGDMLTTTGVDTETDLRLIREIGFRVTRAGD